MRSNTLRYEWLRYWKPRGSYALTDGEGFLVPPVDYDPDLLFSSSNRHLETTSELLIAEPCLILLGEPGIGKSSELRPAYERIESHFTRFGSEGGRLTDRAYFVDLKPIRSYERLKDRLIRAESLEAWKRSDYRLHLFIDGLDECRLKVTDAADVLAEELSELPHERLSLRIACRTAEWPSSLQETLVDLYGADNVGAYELAPLTRADARLAVEANGLGFEPFLDQVRAAGALPFANRPVTLGFLISALKGGGAIEGGSIRLFEGGCLRLCDTEEDPRLSPRSLSSHERLAIASRIAAVSVFTNRQTILVSRPQGDSSDDCVAPEDVQGWTETSKGNEFSVTAAAVRETLDTGLFGGRPGEPDALGWTHQTYAEFLAAWHLKTRGWHDKQVISLLFGSNSDDAVLIPQLAETAAWVALDRPVVLRRILKTDPAVLLRSDVALVDEASRAAIVTRLLEAAANKEFLPSNLDRRGIGRLAHSRLADQLRPFLLPASRQNEDRESRWLAIDIAESCRVSGVQDELAAMVLDPDEELFLRVQAGYALFRIGDAAVKARLRQLLTGTWEDDPEDELRGVVLACLWPHALSAEELFARLTRPKRGSLFGAYKSLILRRGTADHLDRNGLRVGLEWVTQEIIHSKGMHSLNPFQKIAQQVCRRAWQYSDDAQIFAGLVDVGSACAEQYEDPLLGLEKEERDAWRADSTRARAFFSALFERASLNDPARGFFLVLRRASALLEVPRDFGWLLERYRLADGDLKAHYREAVSFIATDAAYSPAVFRLVWDECRVDASLYEKCRHLFDPIDLGSDIAKDLRASHERLARGDASDEEGKASEEDRQQFLAYLTDAISNAQERDIALWWQVDSKFLSATELHAGKRITRDILAPSVTGGIAWAMADEELRGRMLTASRRYLDEFVPGDEWVGSSSLYYPALAAYRAFLLLRETAPDLYDSVPTGTWTRWIPTLLQVGGRTLGDSSALARELLRDAYRHAPDAFRDGVVSAVRRTAPDATDPLRVLEGLWDHGLVRAVLPEIADTELSMATQAASYAALLDFTAQASDPGDLHSQVARSAQDIVDRYLTGEEEMRERALGLSRVLLIHSRSLGWSLTSRLIRDRDDLAREVIESVAFGDRLLDALDHLTDAQVADFFIWLCQQYPPQEDPDGDDGSGEARFHEIGSREQIGFTRQRVLGMLKARGTENAVAEVARIARALPDQPWLGYVVSEARASVRFKAWRPFTPAQVLALGRQATARAISDPDQLLDVVLESLERLQLALRDEGRAAQFLWDTFAGRPKEEEALSDFLEYHFNNDLNARGIVIGREVQIRRKVMPNVLGQRTDLYMTVPLAPSPPSGETEARLIIEVKGCWNDGVESAMKDQLVDRYLNGNSCDHGLYLVVWFDQASWTAPGDTRAPKAARYQVASLQRTLDGQAQSLSAGGKKVAAFVLDGSV
jgi:hypothetical protein